MTDPDRARALRRRHIHERQAVIFGVLLAILAVAGLVNLPVIKFSVDWWSTLHQPSTITLMGAPTMHVEMLWPLLVCTLGFTAAFAAIATARLRAAVMERRARNLLVAGLAAR